MPSQIQIQIVTWNSAAFLPRLFAGIRQQEGVDYSVLVIDNNSQDATRDWLKENAPEAKLIFNGENAGFAKAHNQGFAACAAPFVLVLNPDAELQENFLKNLLPLFADEGVAAAGGRLYSSLPTKDKYGIIDSCGLTMNIFGQVRERGQGRQERGQFPPQERVFGIGAACAVYRVSALAAARDRWGIFDERFGSYKEDVDLAWRLSKLGRKAIVSSQARAWHKRAIGKDTRRGASAGIKIASRRNHLLMLKKNLRWRDGWRLPFIICYEAVKFIHALLCERKVLRAYQELIEADRRG